MPSWNIHLEAGERLANKLSFSGEQKKIFLLGCILPDINNGYINQVKFTKSHEETHFARDSKSSLNFYADYKPEVDARKPIYLGYIFHLYTDGFFNYDFYHTIKHAMLSKNLTKEEKLDIKHHDFWIYDTNFNHRIGISNNLELKVLTKEADKINTVKLYPEEIINVEQILQSNNFKSVAKNEKYIFYTKERLDGILNNMIANFSKDYLEVKDA